MTTIPTAAQLDRIVPTEWAKVIAEKGARRLLLAADSIVEMYGNRYALQVEDWTLGSKQYKVLHWTNDAEEALAFIA